MAKVDTILEEIKGLTLLEASELVKRMEEAFGVSAAAATVVAAGGGAAARSEEHTSELQSLTNLVCRLLLEKKKRPHRASLDRERRSRPGIRPTPRSRPRQSPRP